MLPLAVILAIAASVSSVGRAECSAHLERLSADGAWHSFVDGTEIEPGKASRALARVTWECDTMVSLRDLSLSVAGTAASIPLLAAPFDSLSPADIGLVTRHALPLSVELLAPVSRHACPKTTVLLAGASSAPSAEPSASAKPEASAGVVTFWVGGFANRLGEHELVVSAEALTCTTPSSVLFRTFGSFTVVALEDSKWPPARPVETGWQIHVASEPLAAVGAKSAHVSGCPSLGLSYSLVASCEALFTRGGAVRDAVIVSQQPQGETVTLTLSLRRGDGGAAAAAGGVRLTPLAGYVDIREARSTTSPAATRRSIRDTALLERTRASLTDPAANAQANAPRLDYLVGASTDAERSSIRIDIPTSFFAPERAGEPRQASWLVLLGIQDDYELFQRDPVSVVISTSVDPWMRDASRLYASVRDWARTAPPPPTPSPTPDDTTPTTGLIVGLVFGGGLVMSLLAYSCWKARKQEQWEHQRLVEVALQE